MLVCVRKHTNVLFIYKQTKRKMKRIIIALVVILTVCISCSNEKSVEDILTQYQNGWIVESATSSPSYVLTSGRCIEDLLNGGYYYNCEKDDKIIFKEGGIQLIDPGVNVDPEWGYQEVTSATWSLSGDNTLLYCQIPFFYGPSNMTYDQEQESCKILYAGNDKLIIQLQYDDKESPAKGKYTFTLTFVPVR